MLSAIAGALARRGQGEVHTLDVGAPVSGPEPRARDHQPLQLHEGLLGQAVGAPAGPSAVPGDHRGEGLSAADARLPKNADPFEFQALVEDYAKQSFCLAECVSRLQSILKKDFSLSLSEEDIHRRLRQIGGSKNITSALVEQTFNIQNAGAVASIVSVFLRGG